MFQRDAGQFYRELGKQTIQVTSPPSESEIEQYWSGIVETEVHHNESAFWLRCQTDGETRRRDEQQWLPISDNEVTSCLKRMGNWKSPGSDKVSGFWVKRITCLHTDLTCNYNLLVQNPDFVPDWLSQGVTTLIPKNDKTDQAKNYRPITCLSVFYDPHFSHQAEDCRAFGSEKPYGCRAEGLSTEIFWCKGSAVDQQAAYRRL